MKRDDIMEIIKAVMGCILVSAGAYAWFMLLFLIISFVGLSYISMNIESMFIWAAVGTAVVLALYIRGRVIKRKKSR